MQLKYCCCDFTYIVRLTHCIEMECRNTIFYEFFRLFNRPFNTNLTYLNIVLALFNLFYQCHWHINTKYTRQNSQMIFHRDRLHPRDNGNCNSYCPALFHKTEKLTVIKKQLCDNIIGASIYFCFQMLKISLNVGRF